MKLASRDDRRAVSPVIAVILMVAITVILAAVIGAFVLDVTDNEEATPQIALDISYDDGTSNDLRVTLTGTSTEGILANEIGFKGNNLGPNVNNGDTIADISSSYDVGSRIRAGDSAVLNDVGPDVELEVVWIDNSGKASSVLDNFDGPDA